MEEEIGAELTNLQEAARTFYELNGDTVNVKEDIVKQYLNKLKNGMNGKSSKESWEYLMAEPKRFSTCIIAMQLALESKGYEI
jgi:hypothetical protein